MIAFPENEKKRRYMRSSEESFELARNDYRKLWNSLGSVGNFKEAFSNLVERYNSPNRSYHDIGHIADCLEELKEVVYLAENVSALTLGIFYHDIKDTEIESAEFVKGEAKRYKWPKDVVEKACRLILETKHDAYDSSLGIDGKLITDIDLCFLGKNWFVFLENWKKVRDEWKHIPMDTFVEKRLVILEAFINKPEGMFRTNHFRNLYGAQAIRNIRRARRFFGAG